jgi:hypothetical protein
MTNLWTRPYRPDDLPTLKAWIEEQRGSTAFDLELAAGAQLMVVYDESGIVGFFPFWVSLTGGCPLLREGAGDLKEALALREAVRAVRFVADSQRVAEVNVAAGNEKTEAALAKNGFAAAGKFMRLRHGMERA